MFWTATKTNYISKCSDFQKKMIDTITTSNFYLKLKENNENDMAAQVFWYVFHSSRRLIQISPTADFDGAAIPPPIFSMIDKVLSYFLSTRWNNSPISNQQQRHPIQGDKALKFLRNADNSFTFLSKVAFSSVHFGTILCKVLVLPRNGLFSTIKRSFLGDESVVAKSECILKFNAVFYGMYFAIQIWVRLHIKVQI